MRRDIADVNIPYMVPMAQSTWDYFGTPCCRRPKVEFNDKRCIMQLKKDDYKPVYLHLYLLFQHNCLVSLSIFRLRQVERKFKIGLPLCQAIK